MWEGWSGTCWLKSDNRLSQFTNGCVKDAVGKAGIGTHASYHTLRHSFATRLLEDDYDIRTVQELLDHRDARTTMMYTHVVNRGGEEVVVRRMR